MGVNSRIGTAAGSARSTRRWDAWMVTWPRALGCVLGSEAGGRIMLGSAAPHLLERALRPAVVVERHFERVVEVEQDPVDVVAGVVPLVLHDLPLAASLAAPGRAQRLQELVESLLLAHERVVARLDV